MTQATLARPDAPRRTLPSLPLVALLIAGVLVCLGMTFALRDPDVVPRVAVDNPSRLEVNVDVRPEPGGARLILSNVTPRGSATNRDVLDQGDRWIFGFSSGGLDGGTLVVPRAQLVADGWRVVIPDEVIERLESAPFVPAYR